MTHISRSMFLIVFAFSSISTVVSAASSPITMTCEEFIRLDEMTRPKLVYWFDGFDSHGKQVVEDVNFNRNDRLIPVLVEECTKNPKHLLAKKIKAIQKKL